MSRALIYDADCGFCTRSAHWIAARGNVEIRSWQSLPDLAEFRLTEQMVTEAAYWVTGGGALAVGADAIVRSLIARGGAWKSVGWFILFPPVNWVAKPVYRVIARNRHAMPGGTAACKIPQQ